MNSLIYILASTSILNINVLRLNGADTGGGKTINHNFSNYYIQKLGNGDGGGGLYNNKNGDFGNKRLVGGEGNNTGGGKTILKIISIGGEGSQGGGGLHEDMGGDLGGGIFTDKNGVDGGGRSAVTYSRNHYYKGGSESGGGITHLISDVSGVGGDIDMKS